MFWQSFKNVITEIKNLFVSGLLTIIPIAATIFFINFAYNFLSRCLEPLYRVEPLFLKNIPGSQFFIVIFLIVLIGVLIKVVVAKTMVHYFEHLVRKIPFIRIVYSSAKILVDFFKMPRSTSRAKKVVLIPYPRDGQYHLAFLLESADDSYKKLLEGTQFFRPGEKYFKVFMPNSPNPTSGYFFIMHESDIIDTDITFEEAIKTLVSCGLITPESLKK
jgi:uncharacterized membrane protein